MLLSRQVLFHGVTCHVEQELKGKADEQKESESKAEKAERRSITMLAVSLHVIYGQ